MSQLATGSVFDGKYEVLSRVGGGGMGEVYRVRHLHLDEIRVIKVLRSDLASSTEAAERFRREAQLATQIKHPRVATLHDYSRLEDGSFYMVWESIDGRDIDHWVRQRGVFPLDIAIQLAIQGLSGLEAIHRAHIVHRDISPDNIMITTDNRGHLGIKIIDLGLAGDLREIFQPNRNDGLVGGKLNYCSPEHVGFVEGVSPDHLSDIFGFATVLYFMISGRLPFDRVDSPSEISKRFEKPAHPISGCTSPPVPGEFAEVLHRALSVSREERFASAGEFRVALQGIDALARPPRPGPRLDIEAVVEKLRTALQKQLPDEVDPLLSQLRQSAPEDERVQEFEAALAQLRSTQQRLRILQMREMVDQYLLARQGPLARMALQSLLEEAPDYPEAAQLQQRLEALGEAESRVRSARSLAHRAQELMRQISDRVEGGGGSEGPVWTASELEIRQVTDLVEELGELDAAQAGVLAQEVESWRGALEREEMLQRQRRLVRTLIDSRRLDEAETEIDRLVSLGATKVVSDLFRRDLARVRRDLAQEAKVALIEQELPRAVARRDWQAARELAFELRQERPDHPSVAAVLDRVAREEETDRRGFAAREGAATVSALLDAGRIDEARIALSVLRRMEPGHSLIPLFENRLAQGVAEEPEES